MQICKGMQYLVCLVEVLHFKRVQSSNIKKLEFMHVFNFKVYEVYRLCPITLKCTVAKWLLCWTLGVGHCILSLAKNALSQYLSPGVSMQAGKFNTCADSEMD